MVTIRPELWRRAKCAVLCAFALTVLGSCADNDDAGVPVEWSLQSLTGEGPEQELQPGTSTFTVVVQRLGCSGGVAGTVLDQQIKLRDDEVVISVSVEAISDGPHLLCTGNESVAVDVDLGEPIGDRTLVDGACVVGKPAASTPACSEGSVRWSPPFTQDCIQPTPPERRLDRSAMPFPREPGGNEGRAEFGEEVIDTLTPMVVGADAGAVVANLRALGWTVTVVERSATTTTMTPDLLWSRIVVTTCGDVVDEITFD